MDHPRELEWNEGELPDVHTVPYDCCVLAWLIVDLPSDFKWMHDEPQPENGSIHSIQAIRPWKDKLNALCWNNPSLGWGGKVAYWAWVSKGTYEEVEKA